MATSSANILLGYQAGDNLSTGSNNIVLGFDIDAPSATSANTLNIGNLLFGTGIDGTGTTLSTGKIGIGTTTPAYGLTVGDGTTQKDIYIPKGGLCVDNDASGCPAAPLAGMIYASSTSITGIDLAENYPTFDETIEAGDVVSADSDNPEHIVKSASFYEEKLLGVISTNPGVLLGKNNSTSSRPVALAGRVPVKVSAVNGPIKIGDYLTSSEIPGVAMRTIKPGMVIGMALEPFSGTDIGRITVFVNPHWNLGSLSEWQAEETEETGGLDRFASAVQIALKKLGVWMENGVAQLKEIIAEKISTKELCIEDVCVNKNQLKKLLENMTETTETID
ncbi:MAG: hypothetical protein AAB820_00950, partial [Patescibacteria group bacterium]